MSLRSILVIVIFFIALPILLTLIAKYFSDSIVIGGLNGIIFWLTWDKLAAWRARGKKITITNCIEKTT